MITDIFLRFFLTALGAIIGSLLVVGIYALYGRFHPKKAPISNPKVLQMMEENSEFIQDINEITKYKTR